MKRPNTFIRHAFALIAFLSLAGLAAGFFALTRIPDWLGEAARFTRIYLAIYVIYLTLCVVLAVCPKLPASVFWAGLAVALGGRVAVMTVPVSLSSDVYRYMWDARTAASGVNPFLYAPADDKLKSLRNPTYHDKINHPKLKSIYPPASQYAFEAACRLFGDRPLGFRILAICLDAAMLTVLLLILKSLGLPAHNGLIYALNPAAIVEFSHSAHLDALMLLPLLLGWFWLAVRPSAAKSGAALGAAAAAKYGAAVLAPLFLVGWLLSKKKASAILAFSLSAAAAVGLLFWRYRAAGALMFESLRDFQTWPPSEGSPVIWLRGRLPGLASPETACLALFALAAAGFIWRARPNPRGWAAAFSIMLGAVVLLNPIQRPWYFLWPLPWLAICPIWSLLAMIGVKITTYFLYGGNESGIEEISRMQYAVFYGMALMELGMRLIFVPFLKGVGGARRSFAGGSVDGSGAGRKSPGGP